MIDQITVFLENAEGRLASLCRTLGDANINMQALTIADTTDFGIVRIIADDPERAVDVLNQNDYRAAITKVSAIAVPNSSGGLAGLLETLDSLKLNIEYGYCFNLHSDTAVDVLKIKGVNKTEEAVAAIEAAGYRILSQSDICS